MELVTDWRRFTELTIKTNDLDPMYPVFRGLSKDRNPRWMSRFIMYFLMFYDAGGAYEAAEARDFWAHVKKVFPTAKRGTERRHFRGVNGLRAIAKMEHTDPQEILQEWYDSEYRYMEGNIREGWAGCQMGPYFIWKLFDIFNMIGLPVSLSRAEALKFMPEEPRKAAEMFFPGLSFPDALEKVATQVRMFEHPTIPGRVCDYAEAETILCMMKGFFGTKVHRIGDDIMDKWKQTAGYPELQKHLPPCVDLNLYQAGKPSWPEYRQSVAVPA